jgi:hypothetical protein
LAGGRGQGGEALENNDAAVTGLIHELGWRELLLDVVATTAMRVAIGDR